jgi:hypothetical protein
VNVEIRITGCLSERASGIVFDTISLQKIKTKSIIFTDSLTMNQKLGYNNKKLGIITTNQTFPFYLINSLITNQTIF